MNDESTEGRRRRRLKAISSILSEWEAILSGASGTNLRKMGTADNASVVAPKTIVRWIGGKRVPTRDKFADFARLVWESTAGPENENARMQLLGAISRCVAGFRPEEIKSDGNFYQWAYRFAKGEFDGDLKDADAKTGPPEHARATVVAHREPAKRLPNPFVWKTVRVTGATGEPVGFFGRERELRKLRDAVINRQNFQVVGPRRIGKSMLLFAAECRVRSWVPKAAFAYVDMQDVRCQSVDKWLKVVSEEWGWAKGAGDIASFADRVHQLIKSSCSPVLCLDGCDKFVDLRGQFSQEFFGALRALTGLVIITASRAPLRQLREQGALMSQFYTSFPLLPLREFSETEAEDFVKLKIPGQPLFSGAEVAQILEFSKNHPMRLQIACYHVLEARADGISLPEALEHAGRNTHDLLLDEQ